MLVAELVAGRDHGEFARRHLPGEVGFGREPSADVAHMRIDRRVDAGLALPTVIDGRPYLIGQVLDVGGQRVARLVGVDRGGDRSARLMRQDEHERYA